MNTPEGPIYAETNVEKYVDNNPVTSRLVRKFMQRCVHEISPLVGAGGRILDVGVSEGTMTQFVGERLPDRWIVACEYEPEGCIVFHSRYPFRPLTRTSVFALPFADHKFDLVTAFEVLEHLTDTEDALKEMKRVSNGTVAITVPYEPFFRLGNVARGKHLSAFGNTPGHLNHWGVTSLRALMMRTFPFVRVSRIFPWLLAIGSTEQPV